MLLYVFGFIFCFVQKVVLLPYNIRFSPYETGDLTTFEQEQLEVLVGTTLQFPSGPYITSRKEPDLFIRCNSDILPSFAIECGWTSFLSLPFFLSRVYNINSLRVNILSYVAYIPSDKPSIQFGFTLDLIQFQFRFNSDSIHFRSL
ncbi:hypothetical protein ACN38_g12992 [Penicillium nordicum]|uniref:Uncharacterized protein n=1 Tax=Penicillium nordicum TaxID=229535 RepID=A0A0N0RX92_9EURO|nr:hypothetical protein ACN38_g12992 [Penicillium nordicum]